MSIRIQGTEYPIFPKWCTGCGACSNICPQRALKMELDADGFYKPSLDLERCIGCGKCMKICPVLSPCYKNDSFPDCYAFMATEEIRMRSSSGGIFEVMAKKVIEDGGIVCGVAYTEEFLTEHIFIDNVNELYKIRGSKYVMSDIGNVYCSVKKYILAGRKVLFSGCPCQVAGLSAFLEDIEFGNRLILVDLICHGIPSVKAFRNYLKDMHGNREIKYIGFKEKEFGWHASMTIEFKNGERYNAPCEQDTYFWSYLSGVNKNRACGECKFARIPRQGDITIGDFWGITKVNPDWNDGKGTSVVLVNNNKAREFWNSLDIRNFRCEKAPLEVAAEGNANLVSSPKLHVSRNQFFKNLGIRRFGELANWCYGAERYDIGLVGIPIYVNFGGTLTYYSLYCLLEDYGYKTLMISRPKSCGYAPIMPELVFEKNPYPDNILRLQLRDKEEMSELNNCCETFLVGSDQLFNADLYYRFGEMITLDWVRDNHKKIAYAASFGHDIFWGRDEQRAQMAHYMQKFDAFSVREEGGVKLAKEFFGVDAEWVLDPVFLCDKSHFQLLAEKASNKSGEKHIFAYILDPSNNINDILKYCTDRFMLPIELFSEMLFKPTKEKLQDEQKKFDFILRQARVEERLYSLMKSSLVIADSFHGICFAIIFHIPFVAILNQNRGASRFYTLLRKLNLMDRLVTSVDELESALSAEIDYDMVDQVLSQEKDRCIKWLLDAIETQNVKKAYSSIDIMDNKLRLLEKKLRQKDIKLNALMNGVMYCKENNFRNYLQMIDINKKELLVLIAVKDTPGFQFSNEMYDDMKKIGANISLVGKHWKSYVCVIDSGKLVYEAISQKEERVAYTGKIDGKEYKIVSRSFRKGNIAAIQIEGVDYSENKRGVNIVLVDKNINDVVDIVAFDTHEVHVPCYRFSLKSIGKYKSKEQNGTLKTNTIMLEQKKPEKEERREKEPQIGIKKENEILLHNSLAIAAGGGCTLDYVVDRGIRKIIIYGTDLLAAFVWEQAQYKEIEVVALYSDIDRELDVRFPRIGKIKLVSLKNIDFSQINIPIIWAGIGSNVKLMKLQRQKDIWKIGDLNIYSSVKNFLLEPLKKYKQNGANIPVLIFNMPQSNEIENSSELERYLSSDASSYDKNKIRQKVFLENGYDAGYINEVVKRMEIVKRGKTNFVIDKTDTYVNVVNGCRVTTDVPEVFENTIYFFGNSVCFGLGADDCNTIESHLQRMINQYYGNNTCYSVLNCANGGGINVEQMWNSFAYHMPQDGDIVIFAANCFSAGHFLEDTYGTEFIWVNGLDALKRPHAMGEIYWDNFHVNAKGYEASAVLIFSKMKQENLFHTKNELRAIAKKRKAPAINLDLTDKQKEELNTYIKKVKDECTITGNKKVGSIVMNCNPFTLGHRYLIEKAKKKCDILYVFVVEEDKSVFSFEDRMRLVCEGIKDLEDIIVVPSGNFIISQITFDAYFVKDTDQNVSFDPTMDVSIFASKIAPELGINIRFFGEEPFDKVTNQYNLAMQRILPKYGIKIKIIKRKEVDGVPISASLVRDLLREKKFEDIKERVPKSTFKYLCTRFARSKNILVLGGTRFMGIRLVETLIEKNHFVTIANRGNRADKFGKKVERIKYDRLDEKSVVRAFCGKKYDVIFDTCAYSSVMTKNVLDHVECKRYIQVSSVAVYEQHHLELKEEEFIPMKESYILSKEKEYWLGKRGAECAAFQEYPQKSIAAVRIPFVVEVEDSEKNELNMRLFFYVEHIIKEIPFFVDDLEYCCAFVRTIEEADFLVYLGESKYEGTVNFSSSGYLKVGEIIDYIERKTGKKAILTDSGEVSPFRAKHFGIHGCKGFSFNLNIAKQIGFCPSDLKSWIYELLDKYIKELA